MKHVLLCLFELKKTILILCHKMWGSKKLEMLLTKINYLCFCSKINLESCLPEISNILQQKLQFISLLKSSLFLVISCRQQTTIDNHVEDGHDGEDDEDNESSLAKLHQQIYIIFISWKNNQILDTLKADFYLGISRRMFLCWRVVSVEMDCYSRS